MTNRPAPSVEWAARERGELTYSRRSAVKVGEMDSRRNGSADTRQKDARRDNACASGAIRLRASTPVRGESERALAASHRTTCWPALVRGAAGSGSVPRRQRRMMPLRALSLSLSPARIAPTTCLALAFSLSELINNTHHAHVCLAFKYRVRPIETREGRAARCESRAAIRHLDRTPPGGTGERPGRTRQEDGGPGGARRTRESARISGARPGDPPLDRY